MQAEDIDRLPIVDAAGRFIGVVTTSDILKLDEILEQAEDQRP
jgi:predicted transcriptional regulator